MNQHCTRNACLYMRMRIQTLNNAGKYFAFICSFMLKHMWYVTHTCAHTHTHLYIYIYTHTPTYGPTPTHTHVHAPTHMHSFILVLHRGRHRPEAAASSWLGFSRRLQPWIRHQKPSRLGRDLSSASFLYWLPVSSKNPGGKSEQISTKTCANAQDFEPNIYRLSLPMPNRSLIGKVYTRSV